MARRKAREARPSRPPKSASRPSRYEFRVDSRGLPQLLLIVATILLCFHAVLWAYHYRVDELHWIWLQLFDVDSENNLPTWFSQFLLLFASALLWLCARNEAARKASFANYWYVLSVGFLLMSVDEVAGVHESINSVIVMTWAIPAAGLVLVLGLAFIPFLLHLPRQTALLFATSGALYVIGAVGTEIVGNSMVRQRLQDTLGYKLTTMAEESLEIFGMILFLYALLRYMSGPDSSTLHGSVDIE